MRKQDLEYISETIIINNIVNTDLSKIAGLFDSLGLGDVSSSIGNFVSESAPKGGGTLSWVIDILISGALWSVSRPLAIIYTVATMFGFNLQSIISKIVAYLKPKADLGQKVDIGELNTLGKSIAESQFGPIEEATKESSVLLMAISKYAELNKESDFGRDIQSWIKGRGHGSGLLGFLRSMPRRLAGWAIVGIIIWAIKSLVMAIGHHVIGKPSETKPEVTPEIDVKSPTTPVSQLFSEKTTPTLTSSGRGEVYFKNDSNNLWIVPVINANLIDTLIAWTIDIYPQLSAVKNELEDLPSFRKTVGILNRSFDRTHPNNVVVPQGYHTRKELVDIFSKEAEQLIEE